MKHSFGMRQIERRMREAVYPTRGDATHGYVQQDRSKLSTTQKAPQRMSRVNSHTSS